MIPNTLISKYRLLTSDVYINGNTRQIKEFLLRFQYGTRCLALALAVFLYLSSPHERFMIQLLVESIGSWMITTELKIPEIGWKDLLGCALVCNV
jgi:hypothetical protein